MTYLILEMKTGFVEGVYKEDEANLALSNFIADFPKGTWVLVEIKKSNDDLIIIHSTEYYLRKLLDLAKGK